MQLVTGSRNCSSWTMRVWLLMRHFTIPFDEVKVALNQHDTAGHIRRFSPSGRIPCLVLDDQVVWDSMAICEYLVERFPDLPLWPRDARRRAHARSVCSELHADFHPMRRELKLDLCLRDAASGREALGIYEVRRDVERLEQIWETCLAQYGGPLLFGEFSIADAYFAPEVLRFRTYGISASSRRVADYMHKIERLKWVQRWIKEAALEQQGHPSTWEAQ